MSTAKHPSSSFSVAHACYMLSSLFGILASPLIIIKALPEAPLARPFWFVAEMFGSNTVLAWTLGSLAIWLLVMSRIYDLAVVWRFVRTSHHDKTRALSAKDVIRIA